MREDLLRMLTQVIEPTRAEPGCVRINIYESTVGPTCFYIHSEWADEASFETHARMPHIERLAHGIEEVATHSLQAARTIKVM